jgi:hypothetical protein
MFVVPSPFPARRAAEPYETAKLQTMTNPPGIPGNGAGRSNTETFAT